MADGKRLSAREQSMRIAFCGMMVALSVVLMLTGGLIPVMTYVSPLGAGLLLLPVLVEYGKKYAWTAWLATALIVVVLGVDKEAAFFYLFLGYYPILKWELERLRKPLLRYAVKFLLFTAAMAIMYSILAFLLHLDAVVSDFKEMGAAMTAVFFLLADICLFLYDYLLLPLLVIYEKRLRTKLRGMRR